MKITLKIEKEFDVKFLDVNAGVRYWENGIVDGVEDTHGYLIPCKEGDRWCPIIEIETGKIINWEQGKIAEVHYKVCDDGIYILRDQDKSAIKKIEGYVIDDLSIGDNGYGDYIIMSIDADGKIKDWNPTLESFNESED